MPNEYVNKVELADGSTLIDITDTTAEASDVKNGEVFYLASGQRSVGTAVDTQSDWEEDDSTDLAYILNKPPIIAGDGVNSIAECGIALDPQAETCTIYITGGANAKTYTYTTEDTIPSGSAHLFTAKSGSTYNTLSENIDTDNKTISFIKTFGVSAITNQEVTLFYKYMIAGGETSHAEGKYTRAIGNYSHAEGYYSIASANSAHSEGANSQAIGIASHAEGLTTNATGNYSHSEGSYAVASGAGSHAESAYTEASGQYAHAEGTQTIASGGASHSEGIGGTASATGSHKEGGYILYSNVALTGEAGALTYSTVEGSRPYVYDATSIIGAAISILSSWGSSTNKMITSAVVQDNLLMSVTLNKTLNASTAVSGNYYLLIPSKATGESAHAEGSGTYASGRFSHTEGNSTVASGFASHAEGYHTIANGDYQHANGTYNIADTNGDYIDIVGNGTSASARSNAYTLDWSGNGVYAGKLTVGTGPTNNMDVATKQYVDNATAGITTNLAGLTDTTITSPTDGQLLKYDAASGKWINATPVTYSLSISNNVITLTGSDGSTSSITLPVYNGGVSS